MYIAAKQPLPASSAAEAGEEMVPLSAVGMAKTALYEAMREHGVGRAQLARRLCWHLPQVNRVLDLRHASKIEQVEAALAALGLRLIVDVAQTARIELASSDKSGCGGVDDRTRKDVSMTTTNVTIKVKPLPEGVFLATSDDVPGLTVECETRDEIIATAPEIALELLEIEAGHPLTPRPVVTFAFIEAAWPQ